MLVGAPVGVGTVVGAAEGSSVGGGAARVSVLLPSRSWPNVKTASELDADVTALSEAMMGSPIRGTAEGM